MTEKFSNIKLDVSQGLPIELRMVAIATVTMLKFVSKHTLNGTI